MMRRFPLLAALLIAGCPNQPAGSDGGVDAGRLPDSGPTPDAGRPDAGGGVDGGDAGHAAGCVYDVDCLAEGTRCSADGGCTVAAVTCNPTEGSSNCTSTPYCWTDGINTTNNCYCHPLLDGGGLCYVQVAACGPCTSSLDCGTPDQNVDNPGTCVPLGAGSYCLPLDMDGCPSGYVQSTLDAGTSVCSPACGACPCGACTQDSDCPSPQSGVCNSRGICQPPCQLASDCAQGTVCNVLDKYLDPSLGTLYAAGKCGPPCGTPSDCAPYLLDGGTALVCGSDEGTPRCRPSGCIADSECTQSGAPDASVIGWCDIWNGNDCVGDACRIGENAALGQPYVDCLGGFSCDLPDGGQPGPSDGGPPGIGLCFAEPCYELTGGAHNACNGGQFCCGEGDAGTTCGGAALGTCYEAPNPPWCVTCDPSDGTYFTSDCTGTGDGYPGPVACLTGFAVKQSYCGSSCDPTELWTCPSGWTCNQQSYLVPDCSGCGSNPCLDAGTSQGAQQFQCGCGGGCPVAPIGPLFEGASCASCPIAADAGGCPAASDGKGVNCLCDPDAGGNCPPFLFDGQSYPGACVDVSGGQGTFGCVGGLQLTCVNTVCTMGSQCVGGKNACPADGG